MPRKIKVAHLSDMPFGGAAVAAQRLVQGLADTDAIEVEHWVFGNDESSRLRANQVALEKDCPKTTLERAVRVFSRSGAKALQRRRQQKALLLAIATRKPDIMHLHNLHASALRHEDLALIPRHVHLVWTMHDCWPFAPYAYRWTNERGAEEIQGAERRSVEAALAARKRFFSTRGDVVLVSPSRWLAHEARHHLGAGIRIEVIPYSLPSEIFTPTPKQEAKAALGLNPGRLWLGLAAASFDLRKGTDLVVQALHEMGREDLGVLLWGKGAAFSWPSKVEIRSVGYLHDEQEMARYYSACDLFICPSRIDNLPNTVMESMACGTPVVASDAGGLTDMVRPGKTGWLYKPTHDRACSEALNQALSLRQDWAAYSALCRQIVQAEFGMELQAARCQNLYFEVLGRKPGPPDAQP